jgi:hypothetical protein
VQAAKQRLADTLPHVAAFLLGAIAGALAFGALNWWSIVPAIALVLVCCAAAWQITAKSQ